MIPAPATPPPFHPPATPTPPPQPQPQPAYSPPQPAYSAPQQTHVIIQQAPTNTMGVAGFVLSLLSLLVSGILSPIALIFSIIGLFKEPKGLAIAGTILSVVGLIFMFLFGSLVLTFLLGFFAILDAASEIKNDRIESQPRVQESAVSQPITEEQLDELAQDMSLDETVEILGSPIKIQPPYYFWQSASGGFVRLEFKNGKLTDQAQLRL